MCQAMEKFQKKIYDLGKTDEKTDMIRNMLRAKLDPSLISQIAGVSEEKVREIGSKSTMALLCLSSCHDLVPTALCTYAPVPERPRNMLAEHGEQDNTSGAFAPTPAPQRLEAAV